VARLGSFSAAARESGLSQSQASRIIADLERDVGARLLSRTTRAVVTTEPGAEFLARIEPILVALDEAEHSVREGGELRGLVRMSTPTSMGFREIIPRLPGFAAKHPDLRIQLLIGDWRRDLVREAVDVALRLGRSDDAGGTAKLIKLIPRVILASPAYLERHGAPATPGDLMEHRIVGGPSSEVSTAWTFERDGETTAVELQAHFSTNDNEAAVWAAASGLGITSTSGWACRRELADGSLVRLLSDWKTNDIPLYAHFPMGRATRAAGRAIVDYLRAEFQRDADGRTAPA
jgi:DNA-binding transcriptional LysR family regulator